MPFPTNPVGQRLARVAKVVGRAFDEALASEGGSLAEWLVLLNLTIEPAATQRQLADALGVSEPTITHHLGTMERAGLIERRRDPANRRVHIIEITPAGRARFHRLRDAAARFDTQLRAGFTHAELEALTESLTRLAANARKR